MKKLLIIAVMLLVLSGVSLFADAVGGGFSYGLDTGTGGGTFLMSFDKIPFTMVGLNVSASGDNFHLGITDDYWFYNPHLVGVIKFYMGVGFYVGLGTGDELSLSLGGRIPLGLQAFLLDPLELFIEIAPTAGLGLTPEFSFPNWGVQGLFGLRVWF